MTVLIILAEWVALSILFAAGFSLAVALMTKWKARR